MTSSRTLQVLVPDFSPFDRFNGTAGVAIISKTQAYLIVDPRYWEQAERQVKDSKWTLIKAGNPGVGPHDWVDWLVNRAKDVAIGIDARMISHSKATELISKLTPQGSKLHYPSQNLVDLVWKDKPSKSREPIFFHPDEFTGMSAKKKLEDVRKWIEEVPVSTSLYSKARSTADKNHTGTLITALDAIGK